MPGNETKPSSETPTHIALPAPTMWPMVTAFGITLLVTGLVTSLAVSVVGLVVALVGAVGWWRDVLPADKHEHVPVVPPSERAKPVQVAVGRVEHLKLGQAGHRVRVPAEIHPYSSGLKAGLAGGAVMAVLALGYGLIRHGSVWYPVNLLSAAAVPALATATTEQLRAFNGTGLAVGIFAHGVVSLLVGFVYAVMVPMFPRRGWLWAGIVLPLFWTGLFYGTSKFINPALAGRVDWPWFVVCQIAFGLVTGYVVARSERIETRQTWPLAARIGIESQEERE